MKALKLLEPLTFSLVPREYPNTNDILILTLRHEITNEILNPAFTFEINKTLNITITELVTYFKPNQKFEIELTNDGKIIYLGKLQTFTENTDIQNYEYKEQTNKRFDFK